MADRAEAAAIKARIGGEVRALHPRLIAASHDLHEHPEIAFEERRASALLTEALEEDGFTVERGVAGLETAFVATFGAGGPTVAILAEYDALPKLGHACGHKGRANNYVSRSGAGSGLISTNHFSRCGSRVRCASTAAIASCVSVTPR